MSESEGWNSEIQIHYPLITETALSPDGTVVVYVVREPLMTESESRYLTHLYLAKVEGGEPIQLTFGEHSDHHPRWSPDGRFLAFLSDRSGRANVYAMRVAGGEAWALTAYEESDVGDVKWAPDGQRLAFLMAEPPTEEKKAAQKAKDDVKLWDQEFDFAHLFVVPFAVAPRTLPEAIQLTRGKLHVVRHNWLPNGKALVVVAQPTPNAEDWTETRLYVVPAGVPEDGSPHCVDALDEIAVVADWAPEPMPSPNGQWIACVTGDQPAHWGGASRVVLYPVEGGAPRQLAPTPDGQCWMIGWAADGSRVYVGENGGIDTDVWALPASGEEGTKVLATPSYKGAMHTAGGDVIVFAEETFGEPNAVCIFQVGEREVQKVAAPALPEAWPADALPGVEVIRWQGPGDLEIEGIVTYPVGYEPGDICPLVVDVHGGPAGVFQRRFQGFPDRHCDVLWLASQGFAVLRANPRGSSGYGRTFRFANYGDWGVGDFGDIMAGIDTLIGKGIADPERLGIMGWSYGGYMTSWAITQTNRFRAACVGAGVTNLMSFTGTADIPGFLPDYFGEEFWTDPVCYRRHSAMFHVGDVTTPTLIQHGEADVRVPLGQGRELYNALKRQDVPVEMVIYPRQGHGVSEPRMRIDVRKRPVEWFLRWLVQEA